jgi:hypothetical protein
MVEVASRRTIVANHLYILGHPRLTPRSSSETVRLHLRNAAPVLDPTGLQEVISTVGIDSGRMTGDPDIGRLQCAVAVSSLTSWN